MPKIRATVSLDSETFDNYHRSLLQYVTELGLNGYGRVKFGRGVFSDYKRGKRTVSGGHHFMCTTRMAASPNDGVVDKDSRVFGVSNLYIAGASTFSSPAAVNPTLTLIALAIRLGDHLTKRL
jgi:choline dehydrogenase-like flavoprotein